MLHSSQGLPPDAFMFPLSNKSNKRQATVFLASTPQCCASATSNTLQKLLSKPLLIAQELDSNHRRQNCV
jgi:hypothetical protein